MTKTYTVIKTRRGKETEHTGTVEELVKIFGYTLASGNSWNSRINPNPTTAKGLISSLNKSVAELQGNSYDPDFYELKKTSN